MGDSLRAKAVMLGVLFLVLLTVGVVLSAFYKNTARTRTLVIPFDIAACTEDDGCGLANQIACCPCEAGGGQGAVNTRMRPRLKGYLQRACRGRAVCVNVATCRTDLRAVCRSRRCTLTTAEG